MKIYLYQRFNIKDELFECISLHKDEVHKFMVKDLASIGVSSIIDEENPNQNIDYNDWDPKDIVDMFNEGGWDCETTRQMLFIRYDEIEL